MRVLVTGATGFVGRRVCEVFVDAGLDVLAVVRARSADLPNGLQQTIISGLDTQTDWSKQLEGVDVVVHCAARVHIMNDTTSDPIAAFREVNVAGTLNLARQALTAGVSRFIFLSSIKVNGESTSMGHPLRAEDLPRPVDPYGISKLEAEQALFELASETSLDVVVIRPPLVYGPGVKANFAVMMGCLSKRIPLPFGLITKNRRSLVALDNLVDLILQCLTHPAAGNQVFLVSDDEDLSTADLLSRVGRMLGRPALLVPVPIFLLKWTAYVFGKDALFQRLCGSLQVDIQKTRNTLNWSPPLSVDDGLRRATSSRKCTSG